MTLSRDLYTKHHLTIWRPYRTRRQKCDVQAALGLNSLNEKSELSNTCIIQQKLSCSPSNWAEYLTGLEALRHTVVSCCYYYRLPKNNNKKEK